jgi:hypothetical protein
MKELMMPIRQIYPDSGSAGNFNEYRLHQDPAPQLWNYDEKDTSY